MLPIPPANAGVEAAASSALRRLADFNPIIAYFRSCATPPGAASPAASAHELSAFTSSQRIRLSRCLLDLAHASASFGGRSGPWLAPVRRSTASGAGWRERLEGLRREFEAADAGDGRRRLLLDRLDRELLAARSPLDRAQRCLRLALSLQPKSEEIALALLWIRAKRRPAAEAAARLRAFASRTRDRALRARARLLWGCVELFRGNDRRALAAFDRSRAEATGDPDLWARIAHAQLRLGDEPAAAEALSRVAAAARDSAEQARAAVAFLLSPQTGTARLLAASAGAVKALRATQPEFVSLLLESVQSGSLGGDAPEMRRIEPQLRRIRRSFRAALAAAVLADQDRFVVLALDAASRVKRVREHLESSLARGGFRGCLKALEAGEPTALVWRSSEQGAARSKSEGNSWVCSAAAARIPVEGFSAALLLESDRFIAPAPAELAGAAEELVAATYAAWFRRKKE
ncbi:MAG: hypothetical protein JNJ88_09645 [Planctomycetes bacterium]|nr:hypothetical protein [Planctomycetota bacterium]